MAEFNRPYTTGRRNWKFTWTIPQGGAQRCN